MKHKRWNFWAWARSPWARGRWILYVTEDSFPYFYYLRKHPCAETTEQEWTGQSWSELVKVKIKCQAYAIWWPELWRSCRECHPRVPLGCQSSHHSRLRWNLAACSIWKVFRHRALFVMQLWVWVSVSMPITASIILLFQLESFGQSRSKGLGKGSRWVLEGSGCFGGGSGEYPWKGSVGFRAKVLAEGLRQRSGNKMRNEFGFQHTFPLLGTSPQVTLTCCRGSLFVRMTFTYWGVARPALLVLASQSRVWGGFGCCVLLDKCSESTFKREVVWFSQW